MTLQELVAWLNTRRGGDVVTPTSDLHLSEAGRAEFHQRCDSASPAWTTRGLARPYLQPTATVTWASMVLAMVILLPATGFTQEGTQLTQSIQAQSRVGDFDGDASSDLAVFRPSTGQWLIFNSGTLTSSEYTWGGAADIPVAGDYDGDGKSDIAVFRPNDGNWHWIGSRDGSYSVFHFGLNGDVPVAADYDGDRRADAAVYRGGTWYINRSTAGLLITNFGLASDKPVPAD